MSKQTVSRKQYSSATLQMAVDAIKSNSMTLRMASRLYKIPRATLHHRVNFRSPVQAKCRTVLTPAEENRLVEWSIQMARIGCGRTRLELMDIVKKILDADGRPTHFKENKPGKDWWYAFVRRHPEVVEGTPKQLGRDRAIITPKKVQDWFEDYRKYIEFEVKDLSILSDPSRIYTAAESRFSLCPKSGKVIGQRDSIIGYNFTSSDKTQITVLASMSASGHYLKPMVVYPSQHFTYNPLDGFPEAVFGRSENGSIHSELFFNWVRDVFVPEVNTLGVKKPIVLLVDGLSTHLSLTVCELCRKNDIVLYCLLEYAPHLVQPCDLKFFSSLKDTWKQAVQDFQIENGGELVTKATFARVFRGAWQKSATTDIAVEGFRDAGLFPLDLTKVLSICKMGRSSQHLSFPKHTSSASHLTSVTTNVSPSNMVQPKTLTPAFISEIENATVVGESALRVFERTLGEETTSLYNRRLSEGYALDTDEVYNTWKTLKGMCRQDAPSGEVQKVPCVSDSVENIPSTSVPDSPPWQHYCLDHV